MEQLQRDMIDQKKAYIYGLISVLLWSTVATAFKLSLKYLDYAQLLLYSAATSVLILGLILIFTGKFGLIFTFSKKQYFQSLLYGFLNPFFYYLVLFKAYDLLPAQEAQPLNYTWAITLALLSIPLLGQKISLKDFGAVLVSYSGVVVISTHGNPFTLTFSNKFGVFLALFSTIIWALYWIFNTKDTRHPVAGLFLNFLFGLPLVFVYCLLFSDIVPDHPIGLLGALYVGLFEMGITFVTWQMALNYSINTAKVGNLIFISPFLSLVFIHFLLGEKILVSTFAGLVLIILGLIIQQTKKRSQPTG